MNHTGDDNVIHSFLNSLDVYTHGRSDGETFGLVLTEAMFHWFTTYKSFSPKQCPERSHRNAGKVLSQEDTLGIQLKCLD